MCLMTRLLGKARGLSSDLCYKSLIYEVPTMTIVISSATIITCTLMTSLSIWCVPRPGLGSGHTDHLTQRNHVLMELMC